MKKALIGKKIGMTQVFDENGQIVPVTAVELGPNVVVQKKTLENDGYVALKMGYGAAKEKGLTRPIFSDLKKKNIKPKKVMREVDNFDETLEVGSVVSCDIFFENDKINVIGVSKGKGFQGVIKRHGFSGGRATHGSHFHRAPGSIGACAYPGEVWKGQKMPGRTGGDRVTVKNLKVVKVLKDKNIILVSGAIPGRRNSLVMIKER